MLRFPSSYVSYVFYYQCFTRILFKSILTASGKKEILIYLHNFQIYSTMLQFILSRNYLPQMFLIFFLFFSLFQAVLLDYISFAFIHRFSHDSFLLIILITLPSYSIYSFSSLYKYLIVYISLAHQIKKKIRHSKTFDAFDKRFDFDFFYVNLSIRQN